MNYEQNQIVRDLNRHPNVIIKRSIIYTHKNNVGINTLGKIDYLVNYVGYMRILCDDGEWRRL